MRHRRIVWHGIAHSSLVDAPRRVPTSWVWFNSIGTFISCRGHSMEHPHPCSSNQHSMQTAKEEHPNGYSSYNKVGLGRHLAQRPRGINAKEEHPNGYSSYFSVGLGRHLAQRPRGINSKRGTPKRIFLLFLCRD